MPNLSTAPFGYRDAAGARHRVVVRERKDGAWQVLDVTVIETLAGDGEGREAAEVIEEAAGALACMTALYATPGGQVDQRWQEQINDLIAAAASLEQLADFSRHCHTETNHDQ